MQLPRPVLLGTAVTLVLVTVAFTVLRNFGVDTALGAWLAP
ncbi:hypothetical protein [Nocardioides yefusunii]|uniref:Uncharacterized protein n=1 Tax=Nocardioides yefusunii TaxID=2500546 RepID=A0ABW1QWD4_9ACTN|nr:hypothetical protein [Nocardioides yefusunii]